MSTLLKADILPLLLNYIQFLTTCFLFSLGIDWQVKAAPSFHFNKSVSNLLILRGMDLSGSSPDVAPFQDSCLYPSWMPPSGIM